VLLVEIPWLMSTGIDVPERDAFQEAVAGVGCGHATGVAWSFFAFDPRTASTCENELSPVPGLPCPNPHHGAAAVARPPLSVEP